MSRYRQHLAQFAHDPPVIPIYPILRKDLIFAHEANPTFCDAQLVNFEKLRMIAQIVRNIQRYSSVPYDQAELVGANVSKKKFCPIILVENGRGARLYSSQKGGTMVNFPPLPESGEHT